MHRRLHMYEERMGVTFIVPIGKAELLGNGVTKS